jgi:mono/diheme cytochrome c family protein
MEFLRKNIGYVWLLGALVVIVLMSLKRGHNQTELEYSPNMYRDVGYEPLKQVESNPINPMGTNMRYPVKGTVAKRNYNTRFGEDSAATVDLMVYDIPADSIGIAEATLTNPVPLTDATLKEGELLYGRYCTHCHGEQGKGDGAVAKIYKGVPVYQSDALKNLNDGHIFHVITYGKGRMWPHGSQITPEERWKIVHWVHKLQFNP